MAMGKGRWRAKQTSMWVPTSDLPRSAAHPFYTRLNQILDAQIIRRHASRFGGNQFSAFDKRTGELVWTTHLEACDRRSDDVHAPRQTVRGICHWQSAARS
jgi:hypothetical protein